MPNFKTLVKLTVMSLFVGMIIVFFDITPLGFWEGAINLFNQAFETVKSFISWSLIYIVTGAFVVVPLYAINQFFKKQKQGKNRTNND